MNNNMRNGGRQSENKPEGRPNQGNGHQPQQNRPWKNEGYRRDGQGYKSYNRDNRENREGRENVHIREGGPRPGFSQTANSRKIKTEETIDDIRLDISRIEKEIDLEIKQIATMRLGF